LISVYFGLPWAAAVDAALFGLGGMMEEAAGNGKNGRGGEEGGEG